MVNQFFALMGSIVLLATVGVILAGNSQTASVVKAWFSGFSGSISAARGTQ